MNLIGTNLFTFENIREILIKNIRINNEIQILAEKEASKTKANIKTCLKNLENKKIEIIGSMLLMQVL